MEFKKIKVKLKHYNSNKTETVIDISNNIGWYKNGQFHREDGPAIEWFKGDKEWWLNGKLHRPDGPAVIKPNGDKEYWVEDKLHREDGPAIDFSHRKEWWFNDKLHRIDGPAAVEDDICEWFINGQRHRIDGPAIEYGDGSADWYFNNEKINCSSQKEFEKLIKLKAFW